MSSLYLRVRENLKILKDSLTDEQWKSGMAIHEDVDGDGLSDTIHFNTVSRDHYTTIVKLSSTDSSMSFAIPCGHQQRPEVSYDEATGQLKVGPYVFQSYGETNEDSDILKLGAIMADYFPPWIIGILSTGIPGKLAPLEIVYGAVGDFSDYLKTVYESGRTDWTDTAFNAFSTQWKSLANTYRGIHLKMAETINVVFIKEHSSFLRDLFRLQSLAELFAHELGHVSEEIFALQVGPLNGCPDYSNFMNIMEMEGNFPTPLFKKTYEIEQQSNTEAASKNFPSEYFAVLNALNVLTGSNELYGRTFPHPKYDTSYFGLLTLLFESYGEVDVLQSICTYTDDILSPAME